MKKYSSASKWGYNDGKNAFLLDKSLENPFDHIDDRIAYADYESAWYEGYQEEELSANKLN